MPSEKWDVLIVGAGGAGLRAAVAAAHAGARTLVVDRGTPGEAGATVSAASDWMAYGAAFGHRDPRDCPEQHAHDILMKGGLCLRPSLARRIAEDAPARLRDLERWGAEFDKAEDGTYIQIHSDGATYARACGRGAETGPLMIRALLGEATRGGVCLRGGLRLVDVLLAGGGAASGAPTRAGSERACGAVLLADSGEIVTVRAGAVVLATGGSGSIFRHNALPPGMVGSGYAAALRAGARLANMEFLQIGPCVEHPAKFALSGIFWRLRRRLRNGLGEEFLGFPAGVDAEAALHVKGHSFPFTVRNDSVYVDVAIFREIVEGRGGPHGGVWMDLADTPTEEIERRAEVPLRRLLGSGVDIRREAVEFAPCLQHVNGGVLIGEGAESDLPGLYAAGEAAGGQHGADRPGGNALADTQAFGAIAGTGAAAWAREHGVPDCAETTERLHDAPGDGSAPMERLRDLLWRACTVVREEAPLTAALAEVEAIAAEPLRGTLAEQLDLRDALLCARAHLLCARERRESRGTHFRADYPATDDPGWIAIQTVRLGQDGTLRLDREVPEHDRATLEAWAGSPERRADAVLPCW